MTDQTVISSEPAAPIVSEADALQANMDEFFGHSLDDSFTPSGEFTEGGETTTPITTPEPTPPNALNPTTPAQPAPNAEPAAAAQPGGGEPEVVVDDSLLAQLMLGGTTPPPVEAVQPQAAQAPVSPPQGEPDQAYMPLKAARGMIPPAVLQTLFESEDPIQREDALMGVLTSWGNAILAMSDQRVKDHHYGQIAQTVQQSSAQQRYVQETQADFYKDFPDLQAIPQVVKRVADHISASRPNAAYDANTKKEIGDLSRALARKMGMLGAAPAKPASTPAPFVAGGARPASHGQSAGVFDPLDPAHMVEQLGW